MKTILKNSCLVAVAAVLFASLFIDLPIPAGRNAAANDMKKIVKVIDNS